MSIPASSGGDSQTNVIALDDPNDARLVPYRGRGLPDRTRFVAESEHVVRRLLESHLRVESVLCTPSYAARVVPRIPDDVPVFVLGEPEMRTVFGFPFHRGCAAVGFRPAPAGPPVELVHSETCRTIVVAQGLSDPANVGALVRNCRAFMVDLVVLDEHGGDPFERKAIRASMGNVFSQRVAVTDDVELLVRRARAGGGVSIVAATPDPNATPLNAFVRPARLMLLVGNEGHGLSSTLLESADVRLRIPMDPSADSINVAAATAILLYALGRTR